MAYVAWSAGIDYVSGALSKPSRNGQHACNKMLLGTHRQAPTTNDKCTYIYLRKKVKRNTAPSSNELWARTRFAAVAAAVKARKEDLMNVNTDKQNFLAQKDDTNGKKTFKAYLWSICAAAYDQAHPRN
ncbi:MAG: hypothetical protein IKX20_03825 [Paludibacteraceae bacterium]|nr:hypothetical protein [Paludibacteraceae bacterium]